MNDNRPSGTLGMMTVATPAHKSDTSTPPAARKGGRSLGVLASTTSILVGSLLVMNYAFTLLDATKLVPMSDMTPLETAERSVTYKMRALEAMPQAPDILLVGSSLPMSVAVYADAAHCKPQMDAFLDVSKREHLNAFQAYPGALYFSQVIRNRTGRAPSIFNLTVPACMTSDAYFLMNEAIARKKPQMVVWGIAPRDFVDNIIPPVGKTPAFAALPDWTFLGNVVPFQKNFTAVADSVSAAFIRVYNDRVVLKHALFSELSTALHHPQTLAEAQKQQQAGASLPKLSITNMPAPSTKPTAIASSTTAAAPKADTREPGWNPALLPQYKDYDHRYNPPNYRVLNEQSKLFADALASCRAKGIHVVLVNMPLPRRHQALIDPALHAAYHTRVQSLATKYGATYIDLNHPDNYTADDWIDSLHVTASGADKFLNELVPQLPPVTPRAEQVQSRI